MDYPLLKKAPIAEAILQIKFERSENLLVKHKIFFNKIEDELPFEKERYSFSKSFKFGNELEDKELDVHETSKRLDSFLYYSEDRTKSITLSEDYYSFHMINKYSNWNEFKSLSKKYWDLFDSTFNIGSINKLTLRYINKIPLVLPLKIEDYLNVSNMGGDALEYDLFNFFTKYLIFSNQYDAPANIVLATEKQTHEDDNITIVLDIDTFKEVNNEVDIWEYFEKLRHFKNDIFFNILTKETIKTFGEL